MSGTGFRYLTPAQMRALASKPALSNGTETSDAAARTVEGHRTAQQQRVLDAFRNGEATADEIEVLTGLSGSSVRPRIVELCEANVLERIERKRPTRSGSLAFVYRVR